MVAIEGMVRMIRMLGHRIEQKFEVDRRGEEEEEEKKGGEMM